MKNKQEKIKITKRGGDNIVVKYEFGKEEFMMYDQKIPKSMTIEIQVDNVHDKIFKTVLSNREEMSKLLKRYVGLEEIESK